VGIVLVDNLFNGSRYQNVAVFVQQTFTSVRLSSWESDDGSVLKFVVFEFLEKVVIRKYTLG
jgi:hypothetical protein